MGDGVGQANRLSLCSDSYSIQDVVRLMNVLIIKYRLECTLHKRTPNQFRIYIRQRSTFLLKSIVSPYMHYSMLYKFGSIEIK
jgi:LAGLIDADG DNA endonuclease family